MVNISAVDVHWQRLWTSWFAFGFCRFHIPLVMCVIFRIVRNSLTLQRIIETQSAIDDFVASQKWASSGCCCGCSNLHGDGNIFGRGGCRASTPLSLASQRLLFFVRSRRSSPWIPSVSRGLRILPFTTVHSFP